MLESKQIKIRIRCRDGERERERDYVLFVQVLQLASFTHDMIEILQLIQFSLHHANNLTEKNTNIDN